MARTPEEYFDDAAAVFAGQVMDVYRITDGYAVTFNVSQYWKGLSENDRFVTVQLHSMDTGLCGYPMEEGEEYLTYAASSGDGLAIGACEGTGKITDTDSLTVLGVSTIPRGSAIYIDSDPLDGVAPLSTASPYRPDLVLIAIVAAIASLSAGLAILIVKKPKR